MQRFTLPAILLIVCIAAAGCATSPHNGSTWSDGGSTSPGPTQTLPPGTDVDVQVNEKDTSYATVTVIFAGGPGQNMVKTCAVRLIRSDGKVETGSLAPVKQETLTLQGTKGTDRIQVRVTQLNGSSYVIIDKELPYRTRG